MEGRRGCSVWLLDMSPTRTFVKIWGEDRPRQARPRFHRAVRGGAGEYDIAVEVSTAGLRKAWRDYPGPSARHDVLGRASSSHTLVGMRTPRTGGVRIGRGDGLLGRELVLSASLVEHRNRERARSGEPASVRGDRRSQERG